MTNSMTVRPSTIMDAHFWWINSAYMLRSVFRKDPMELHVQEVRNIVHVRRRFFVEFERNGLIHRIVLRELPREMAALPVIEKSWWKLPLTRDAFREIGYLTTWTATVSFIVGVLMVYRPWPYQHSLARAALTAFGGLVVFPFMLTMIHAAISLRRAKCQWIRHAVKAEIVCWIFAALFITGFIAKGYSDFHQRHAHAATTQSDGIVNG